MLYDAINFSSGVFYFLIFQLSMQNTKLSERVEYLETCECEPRCKYDGKIFKNQETWQTDMCTICQCQVSQFLHYQV